MRRREVKEIIPVDLGPKRDQIETKELPEFAQLRTHVYRLIKREQADEEGRVPELVEPSLGEAGTASRSGG